MSKFLIKGARRLSGNIEVSGSKNAALPIIFSTVITRGVSILSNVPDITDVNIALQIISELGAVVLRFGDEVHIDTCNMSYSAPRTELTSRIRASSYLLGANLARFGRTEISRFGGCNFDDRPIDMHLSAMRALGAQISVPECTASELFGADIRFDKISVGATVNAILLSATAKGVTRIFGYAREPHIYSLIDFLTSAGASITPLPEYILIEGRELHGGRARIIPDMIEAGTYLIASLALASPFCVKGVNREHLSSLVDVLVSAGAGFEFFEDTVTAFGKVEERINLSTAPYPGYPTDLQPQIAPLLAASFGGSITEGVWHSRFGYLRELQSFGLEYSLSDAQAVIYPSHLKAATATAPDLRGGAALMIAALIADGESVIDCAQIIARGYEGIAKKLRNLGADIEEY